MGFYGPKYPLVNQQFAMENGPQKQMAYLLKIVIFYSYVKLPEGTWNDNPIYNHRNHRLQKGSKVVENYQKWVQYRSKDMGHGTLNHSG